jgi:hypothetical protein
LVIVPTAVPTTYRSPGSTSGIMAARAALKGGEHSSARNNRMHSANSDIPGSAMVHNSPARTRSQTTMTSRRGSRSASPDSSGPPMTHGRKLMA